jgi:DMSO reductase family type II enzyme chaperone
MMELTELRTESERIAAQRSRLYQVLGCGFAFPDPEFFDAVQDGTFAGALARAGEGLPYELPTVAALTGNGVGDASVGDASASETSVSAAYTDFESEYIRLFDVGAAGPPCPLYGGVYVGDRMKVMEDATRFYNFFQLRLSPQLRELPDHITTELEFMHYLSFREAAACQLGVDPAALLRAERDFLSRHLCKWVPRLQAKMAKQDARPFFPALVGFAATFFERDRAHLASCIG